MDDRHGVRGIVGPGLAGRHEVGGGVFLNGADDGLGEVLRRRLEEGLPPGQAPLPRPDPADVGGVVGQGAAQGAVGGAGQGHQQIELFRKGH